MCHSYNWKAPFRVQKAGLMGKVWVVLAHRFRNCRHGIFSGVFCGGIASVIVLSVVFWEWLNDGESGSTTIRNVALVVAGAIALAIALWRSRVADRQANTAQQSLLNERYQKGAEMLGSEVLSVRLGGIYALQSLAQEHPGQYHVQIMRLFCAFVRYPTRGPSLKPDLKGNQNGDLLGIRQDVEAVIQAIGSRPKSLVALERNASFKLDLRGADLHGAQLLDADLSNAMLHHSNLSSVNFANTDLTDSFLSYSDLSQAQFHDVNFTRTRFWFADLSGAMLQDADLAGVDFSHAKLHGTNLGRANLSGANFQYATATKAWFESADLFSATFLRADLSGARLMKAGLTDGHFLDANLTQADISGANISGVGFSNGGIQPAKGLTQAQLDEAQSDSNDPPTVTGVLDAGTGRQLVWLGRRIDDES